MIAGTIKSEIRSVEKNLSEMIFKMAVEQSVSNNIVAFCNEIDPDSIESLRQHCARSVAKTNGIIDLEKAFRWQGGES